MAGRKKVKVILDTNWYISASINAKSWRKLYELLQHEKMEVIYSQELLAECKEVMRKKFSKKISTNQVLRFIA